MSPRFLILAIASTSIASASFAAVSIAPMSSFGSGDGWRAPNEVITGDSTGVTYPYLGTGSLERGMDYNPATGNLILVSRSTAGNGIRVLHGTTGADLGAVNQGTGVISGGTFTTNMVGVANDGTVYVSNLAGNTNSAGLKIYKWTSETASAPTVFASAATATGTTNPRLGDSLDVVGSGSSTRIAAGFSATTGYAVYDDTGAMTVVNPFAAVGSGDFRLGITFTSSNNDVWGKQTGGTAAAAPLRRTTYSGSTGTLVGSSTLSSGGEMAMDYLEVSTLDANNAPLALKLLATLDANSSIVRIYDVSTPGSPVLAASATATSGTLSSNGNAVGNIAFGATTAIDAYTTGITLYAMSTNQGIQAFNIVVPEPASLSAIAGLGMLMGRRRK